MPNQAAVVLVRMHTPLHVFNDVPFTFQEVICNAQAEESRALKASCETDLAEALPALESAVSALKSLSKGDIVEVSAAIFADSVD